MKPATLPLSQTIVKVDLCPSLTQYQQNIIIAMHKPKIRQYFNEKKKDELVKEIIEIISKAIFYSGQKMEAADLSLNARNLAEYLDKHYPAISVWQLREAFEQGSIGRYGDFFGLNLTSFIKWINSYLNSEDMKAAIRIQSKHNEDLKYSDKVKQDLETEELNRKANELMIADYRADHDNLSPLKLQIFKSWCGKYFDKNPDKFNFDNEDLKGKAIAIVKSTTVKVKYNSPDELREARNLSSAIKEKGFELKEVKSEYKFLCVREWILKG